jgi:hypothetical protein
MENKLIFLNKISKFPLLCKIKLNKHVCECVYIRLFRSRQYFFQVQFLQSEQPMYLNFKNSVSNLKLTFSIRLARHLSYNFSKF